MIDTKKVNISVLIVKIIPGQEFVSNDFSPVLVPTRPSQDRSSLLSNLCWISCALPIGPTQRKETLLDSQQQVVVKSTRLVSLGRWAPDRPISPGVPRCRRDAHF